MRDKVNGIKTEITCHKKGVHVWRKKLRLKVLYCMSNSTWWLKLWIHRALWAIYYSWLVNVLDKGNVFFKKGEYIFKCPFKSDSSNVMRNHNAQTKTLFFTIFCQKHCSSYLKNGVPSNGHHKLSKTSKHFSESLELILIYPAGYITVWWRAQTLITFNVKETEWVTKKHTTEHYNSRKK